MSFDVAASAYDAFMGRWSKQLSAGLADLAGVADGLRILDVGAGTGMLTEELVARVGAASVAAVEPSAPFVGALAERFPGVDVRQASAEQLPFGDGAFDAALAQLVVHFMKDPVAGLAEMRRVTRPGGAVAVCVWDYVGGRGPLGVFWDVAADVVPDAPGEAHLPGTAAGQLAAFLTQAGLRDVVSTELGAEIEHPTFDTWWQPFTKNAGPAGAFVARLAPGDVERLRRACAQRLGDGPITVRAVAWAARGTV